MYENLWKKALPLLKKGLNKDFVLHTRMVVRAMKVLIKSEGGNENILIPAAILHDVGWSEVNPDLQKRGHNDREKDHLALVEHIKKAPSIIRKILGELAYGESSIKKIIEIVETHKFTDPQEKDKQLLIDADTLSDTYKKSFYSDALSYHKTPQELWEFRCQNTFYTQTAKRLFKNQLRARLKEINK